MPEMPLLRASAEALEQTRVTGDGFLSLLQRRYVGNLVRPTSRSEQCDLTDRALRFMNRGSSYRLKTQVPIRALSRQRCRHGLSTLHASRTTYQNRPAPLVRTGLDQAFTMSLPG
jgi:hypothetical protein